MTALTDRIDAVSRDLITQIQDHRDQAAELRLRADEHDAEGDALRAELGDWNAIRSRMGGDLVVEISGDAASMEGALTRRLRNAGALS